MPLPIGSIFGHYEILAAVGSGGMGRVFRARDLDLHRDVALKVLLPEVSGDPDRLTRLIREAQVLASLNHPNIAGIYALEQDQGVHALVMEFVEGPTLADRLTLAPVPMQEALVIARQIADALCTAHEQGVVHRDLKPANVKVRPDGAVKVLDFGLAKALDPRLSDDPTKSPTLSWHATSAGVILGTAAYMSPEQAAGRGVDRRSDLWSFGVMLLEMLTGRPVFQGETVSHVLAAVLKTEPDWSSLPADTPPAIRRLLRRCLQKDPRLRLADAGDARLEIEDALATPADEPAVVTRRDTWLPWIVAAVMTLVAAGTLVSWRSAPEPRLTPIGLEARLGADAPLSASTFGPAMALSPDGTALVFVAEPSGRARQLYVRALGELTARPIPGTANADAPFFSPDGRWVAFFADGRLKKVALAGGAAVTICEAPNGRGGDWGDDQQIVFQPNTTGPLMRVSSGGGVPVAVTSLADGEVTQRWPQIVENGSALLFTSHNSRSNWENATIVLQPLNGSARTVVHRGGYYGRYVPTGHLLFVQQGLVFAKALDLARPAADGSPLPVVETVLGGTGSGAAHVTLSSAGTLAYVPRPIVNARSPMVWIDRSGVTTPLLESAVDWRSPQLSPDGSRFAIAVSDGQQNDIWIGSVREPDLTRFTFETADDLKPVWTPDGQALVFGSTRGGALNLFWQSTDDGRPAQRLTDSPNAQAAGSWHPDGTRLAYQENRPATGQDIVIAPVTRDARGVVTTGSPTVFAATPFSEVEPVFSPDGRWLAYVANTTGRDEVYVRPFPEGVGLWQVSNEGGTTPTWSRAGRELLYRALTGELMAVSYTAGDGSFRPDLPRAWAAFAILQRPGQRSFDLHPDGRRVVAAPPQRGEEAARHHVTFVFNFLERLRAMWQAD